MAPAVPGDPLGKGAGDGGYGNEDPWAGMDDCFPPYGPEGEMSGALAVPKEDLVIIGGPDRGRKLMIPAASGAGNIHMAELLGAGEESPIVCRSRPGWRKQKNARPAWNG